MVGNRYRLSKPKGQMLQASPPKSLYDRDFLQWIEDTVAKLKVRNFAEIDLENLIEEIEALGRSQRKELKSRLLVLLEYLLKRLYVDSSCDYRGWENTIFEQRQQIEDEWPFEKDLEAMLNYLFWQD
jgi:hypothetical protein